MRTKLLILGLVLPLVSWAQQMLDLGGEWSVSYQTQDGRQTLSAPIVLPGSMAEQGIGWKPAPDMPWSYSCYDSAYFKHPRFADFCQPGDAMRWPFFLTPRAYYKGVAAYQRTVTIPPSWRDMEVALFLERPHGATRVVVDGDTLPGVETSLSTPHRHRLTAHLQAGRTVTLTVLMDNTLRLTPVGRDAHSVTDNTQGNWNGLVGKLCLEARPAIHIVPGSVQVWPDVEHRQARLTLAVAVGAKPRGKLSLVIGDARQALPLDAVRTVGDTLHAEVMLTGLDTLWSPGQPYIYERHLTLLQGKRPTDTTNVRFGMRHVDTHDRALRLNGHVVTLRANVESCVFPLTGYPPTETQPWQSLFQTLLDYGFNAMRFHSWCPPEAAFAVADSMGIMLQAECPTWANHGTSISPGNRTARYVEAETERILQAYGNHPSFVFMAAGNEPIGRWVEWGNTWVQHCRERDARRLYTAFAVGGSWPWAHGNEFHARAGARGLDWGRHRPQTLGDYHAATDTMRVPLVCHELGQWAAFPRLADTLTMTGAMRPDNLRLFARLQERAGMASLADSMLYASGRLQVLCYKHEIERLRRTPHYAGYMMEGLNDYPGQGSAFKGLLNALYEPKGYLTAQEWRQWNSPTVVLMRTRSFVLTNADTLGFTLEVVGDSPEAQTRLAGHVLHWQLLDQGTAQAVAQGHITLTGDSARHAFQVPLATLDASHGRILRLATTVTALDAPHSDDTMAATNTWDFFLFDAQPPKAAPQDVLIARAPTEQVLRTLLAGGKVLLLASEHVLYGRNVKQQFLPAFWNRQWMSAVSPETTGLLIHDRHPAFDYFPTECHSDMQWWNLVREGATVMRLDKMPSSLHPLVQSIDNPYEARNMGMLFEARVGKGRLMVTSFDLQNHLERRPEARQLRRSLLEYMSSDDFQPRDTISAADLTWIFTHLD